MQNLIAKSLATMGAKKMSLSGTCFQVEMKKGACELKKACPSSARFDEQPVFLG